MSRRVYIHHAPALDGRRRAVVIGACAFVAVIVLAVQARLTFSEYTIAQAREEFVSLSEGVRTGATEVAPTSEDIAEVKDAVEQTRDAFTQQFELQTQLNAAAAAAAEGLAAGETEIAPSSETPTVPATEQPSQPETSTTP
ncbi:MAG: hypothetical protein UY72_C0014G0002 [Candidatus Uhrbacteria bacterium GW2011_GWD2_52_7]|uniref:Uncharacterized protein n=1 Tax=Candidatus Uhrbacteria bacterium GW2011_GWD2_52_7 TaxID=1618989 RepID=A0A0G1XHF3_9BACT|nr:MAG: hypothetical protein UY72_C0014G0002 [Candidatus Uhrbacteria bacterium GW2011_GWD2_52_7]